ncbi:MAG: hypothetical protein OEW68_15205 [Gammaproteobacteria bacterium]|nr:hypothetical protein [Gammaproteobacteria bacterium]MDH4316175.1 hypothetical protein [Gammaproteobacteria bacterium]
MSTRREFLKKVGYTAPVVLTMAAKPSFASNGSGRPEDKPKHGSKNKKKKKKAGRRGHHDAAW